MNLQAEQLLEMGKERYAAKDLMPALKHFEDVLSAVSKTHHAFESSRNSCTRVRVNCFLAGLAMHQSRVTMSPTLSGMLNMKNALSVTT